MTIDDKSRRSFSDFDAALVARAGIAILGLALLAIAVSRIIYPFDTGNAEALSWIPAGRLFAGENPYAFAAAPPFIMSAYGVVYYAIIGVGVKLFGLQIWSGRLLSVVGFVVCLWAAAKITRRLTANREAVYATVLAGLALFPMQMWIGLMRSDLMAAAFASAALALCFTVGEKDRLKFHRLAAIIVFAALAFFTKHTYSLPACFIFLRFLQIGKRRGAFSFAAAFAVIIGAGIFLLDYTSSGGYIWQHFVHARHLPFGYDNLRANLPFGFKLPAYLIFLIFLLIFLYGKREFSGAGETKRTQIAALLRSPRLLILMYFAASFATAFVSSGRVGANVNYYIENSFSAIIICGLIYDWLRRIGAARLSFALVALLAASGAFQLAQIGRGEYFRWQSLAYYREIFRRVGDITAASPEKVCVSVAPELVVWNGCALEFIDYEEYDKGWSPELERIFAREMETGRFAAIVWHNDTLQTRFPNYRLVRTAEKPPGRFSVVFLYEKIDKQSAEP